MVTQILTQFGVPAEEHLLVMSPPQIRPKKLEAHRETIPKSMGLLF